MSKESDEYEKFIANIIEDIKSTGRDIKIICYGCDCKLKGKTGQEHQINVAFIDHFLPTPATILVECKLRGSRNVEPRPDHTALG